MADKNRTTALAADFDQIVCDDSVNDRNIDYDFVRQYAINFLLTDQLEPIAVRRLKKRVREVFTKNRYAVRYGFHRYHAFELLHNEGIPVAEIAEHFDVEKIARRRGVSVIDGRLYYRGRIDVEVNHESVKAADFELRRASENLVRKDYSPIEEARIFASMRDNHGFSNSATSLFLGGKYSANQVADRLWLLKLPQEVQDKLHSGVWAISKAYDLYNDKGEKKAKRAASALSARGKRAFNNALKAIEEGKTAGNDLLDGMSAQELEIAKRVLRWCRGEKVNSLARSESE